MAIEHIGNAVFVEAKPAARRGDYKVYAFVEFPTLERAYYGLFVTDTDHKGDRADEDSETTEFSEPIDRLTDFDEALKSLEDGDRWVFEEYPAVEVTTKENWKAAMKAAGEDEKWDGPGVYDFRDFTKMFDSAIEAELSSMEFEADSLLDYLYHDEKFDDRAKKLLDEAEED